jgi:peptidoglycan/LPS O-acetylase OafA/YrhL
MTGQSGHRVHRTEFPVLHLLRVLAAICIFAGHWSEPYVRQAFPQGQLAIDTFFMIEGFLAARHLASCADGAGALALARMRHVYPIYLGALLLGFVTIGALVTMHAEGWTPSLWLRSLLAGAALLPVWTTGAHGAVYPLNPPSWAIVLELAGFAALAFAYRRSPRLGPPLLWMAGTAVLLAFIALRHDPNMGWRSELYWGGWPRMVFGFFGGALLFSLHARSDRRLAPAWPLALILCAAFLAIQFLRIWLIAWPLLAIVTPLIVLSAARVTQAPSLMSMGGWAERHALAIYLLGYPVMMGWRTAQAGLGLPPTFTGSVPGFALVLATVLLAAEIWVWAEQRVSGIAKRPSPVSTAMPAT